MGDGAPASAVPEPAAVAAATKAAAIAALRSLGAGPDRDEAASEVSARRDVYVKACAARDAERLSSSDSNLQAARCDLLAARADKAEAQHGEARKIKLLTEIWQDPNGWSEHDVARAASDARDQRAEVSRLRNQVRQLGDRMQAIRAARPPRHLVFAGADDEVDAVVVSGPKRPLSLSDQAASKRGKVGPTALPCMGFDTTSDARVWRSLVPDRESAAAGANAAPPRLMAGVMLSADMRAAPEKDAPGVVGVQSAFGDFLDRRYLGDGEVIHERVSLTKLKLPTVHTSSQSTPDSVGGFNLHPGDFVPLRVREYKGSESSCMEALPQALASGACIAVGLLMRGLRADDIVVPVDVATGKNVQFAAVFIAGGRLPMCVVTSEELDLSHRDGARLADLYYSKTRAHVQNLMQLVKEAAPVPLAEAEVDVWNLPEALHCKRNSVTFKVLSTKDASVWHVMRVLSHLHHVGPRQSICFPLGFCFVNHEKVPDGGTMDMVFLNLAEADPPYSFTVPKDWAAAKMFVAACGRVVSQLHAAGVVHGDLYVSNIVWRRRSDQIEVKVLDWDTAFFVAEHADEHAHRRVPELLYPVWQQTNKWRGRFSVTGQVQELDLFMIRAMRWAVHDNDPHAVGWKLWQQVADVTSVGASNTAFRALQEVYLSECSSTELLQDITPGDCASA